MKGSGRSARRKERRWGRAGGNVRTATCAEVVSLCASGQCVVVAGVNGSGKSTLLREVAAALHASGISVHPFRGAEAEGHRRIADAAPDAVVIVDDFEQASAEIVRACLTRAARGGRTVFAVLDGPQRSRPLHELTHDHTAADSLHTVWNACTTVRLDALPPDTLERLSHAHSSEADRCRYQPQCDPARRRYARGGPSTCCGSRAAASSRAHRAPQFGTLRSPRTSSLLCVPSRRPLEIWHLSPREQPSPCPGLNPSTSRAHET